MSDIFDPILTHNIPGVNSHFPRVTPEMSELTRNIERLNAPERWREVSHRHTAAFAWQPQGHIPLGLHVVDPHHGANLDYHDWLEARPFLDFQRRVLVDTLAVGSDLLPAVAINHLGDAVVTSMFGAKMLMPECGSSTLQDVGPTPIPTFASIEEAVSAPIPGPTAGILPQVEALVAHYRQNLPLWVRVVGPMPSGPFSTAMALRGSDMLVDLVDRPELCHRFVAACADAQILVESRVRRLTGVPIPGDNVTNFCIQGAGLRLGEDSLVNLSPAMIREFGLPAISRINRVFGGRGHVHFCSLPHSRFEQVYEALVDVPEVQVVSSQFGFEYYAAHLDRLRGRLAIECFYGQDAIATVRRQYGSFRDWANEFVPRFKDESGLVMYVQVDSVEEARDMWADWTQAHRRS